jgi:hypothetical protein
MAFTWFHHVLLWKLVSSLEIFQRIQFSKSSYGILGHPWHPSGMPLGPFGFTEHDVAASPGSVCLAAKPARVS